MTRKSILSLGFATLAGLSLATTNAQAQNIAAAKATVGNTATVPNAIVTYVVNAGATNSTFLIQDTTGATEVFSGLNTSYTPVVGDSISITAPFTTYKGLYEFKPSATAGEPVGGTHNNALPAPSVFTIANTEPGQAVGQDLQATLGTLSSVTFTGANATGTFGSNMSYSVTDGVTPGTTTIFIGSTSPFLNTAIPTGPVSISGYLSQYDSTLAANATSFNGYELIPTSFAAPAAAPEPSGIVAILIGMGLLGLVAARRRTIQAA